MTPVPRGQHTILDKSCGDSFTSDNPASRVPKMADLVTDWRGPEAGGLPNRVAPRVDSGSCGLVRNLRAPPPGRPGNLTTPCHAIQRVILYWEEILTREDCSWPK
jgi:hypothetical protein